MKILYCCHADNYHIEKWIPALQRVGIEIHVLTLRPSAKLDVPQTIVKPIFSQISWFDFWIMGPKIRQTFHEVQADILFCSFASTYGLGGLLSGITPFFVQTWSRDIGADSSVNKKDAWISQWISRKICSLADGITTDGPHFKDHVENHWPEIPPQNVCSTWWGIDTDFWKSSVELKRKAREKWNIPSRANVIISPRGVFWYYRPFELLRAFIQLLDEDKSVFVIIPTLNHAREMAVQELIQQLKEHPRVLVCDYFLEPNDFLTLLQASDVLISVPLFDGISEVIQEGLACGLLPVMNPIPANQVIASQGFIVELTSSVQPNQAELVRTLKKAVHRVSDGFSGSRNKQLIEQTCSVQTTAKKLKEFFKV